MINTWNESLLHEELKAAFCGGAGRTEVEVEGSICDAVLDDDTIVEVQTSRLGRLRPKLGKLLPGHRVNLVHPIALTTRLETRSPGGALLFARRSPKRGTVHQLYGELTGIHDLVGHPNLTITVVYSDVLELRVADGTGSWRRRGVRVEDRRLLAVHGTESYGSRDDFRATIPPGLPGEFTVRDLAAAGAGRHAGEMAWVLRKWGLFDLVGKRGNAHVYRTAPLA